MASLKSVKKEIDYLVSAVISDCYTCLILGGKSRESVLEIIEDAIDERNKFIEKANNPADKKNKGLVKKHYAALRNEIMEKVDELFVRLSDVCKQA
ncbi:MAG: hypothetical protein RR277_02620 [Rikenellaceae bacterium]